MGALHGRYTDRFDAARYQYDEPVGVFTSADDAQAVWVPERLFLRLADTARAYELHLLPLLGGTEPIRLNTVQVQTLVDEFDFVAALLRDDPLVVEQVARLNRYLRRVAASDPDSQVTVEGP